MTTLETDSKKLFNEVRALPSYGSWHEICQDLLTSKSSQANLRRTAAHNGFLHNGTEAQHSDYDLIIQTELLKADVAEAKQQIDLPHRLGMLTALDRHFNMPIGSPWHPVKSTDTYLTYRSKVLDSRAEDLYGRYDPITYASQVALAIIGYEDRLPKRKLLLPAVILSIGEIDPAAEYQETTYDIYNLMNRKSFHKTICDEPEIRLFGNKKIVDYQLPELAVYSAEYNTKKHKIKSISSRRQNLPIPEIEMLSSVIAPIMPKKLLLGKEATRFAFNHRKDLI
jgi:hypothetical protein